MNEFICKNPNIPYSVNNKRVLHALVRNGFAEVYDKEIVVLWHKLFRDEYFKKFGVIALRGIGKKDLNL